MAREGSAVVRGDGLRSRALVVYDYLHDAEVLGGEAFPEHGFGVTTPRAFQAPTQLIPGDCASLVAAMRSDYSPETSVTVTIPR